MRISDWSSDVCSSDLGPPARALAAQGWRAGDGAPGRHALASGGGSAGSAEGHAGGAARQAAARQRAEPLRPLAPRLHAAPHRRSLRLRSEEHTSELQSLMRISYAVFCLKKKKKNQERKKERRRKEY